MDARLTLSIQALLSQDIRSHDGIWGAETELSLARSRPFHILHLSPEIESRRIASRLGIDPDFVVRVFTLESNLDQKAVSATGAIGVAQLTMSAVNQFNETVRPVRPVTSDDRKDMLINITVGVWYLRWCAQVVGVSGDLNRMTPSDRAKTYGAYNIGIGAIRDLELVLSNGVEPSARLSRAMSVQAHALVKDGVAGYLGNVEKFVG